MEWTEIIILILEIIGTISFAISGAFVAIKVRFDIFGVLVIGTITAVGGGIMRDVLIGNVPPTIFSRVYILLVACATSLAVFLISNKHRKKLDGVREKVENVNNLFDAIGLATFTVMGTELAFSNGIGDNAFLALVLGALTGVGGGLLRDILTETQPYIFKKHVYAVAAISGAGLYYLLRFFTENTLVSGLLAILFIISVRILARKYRWELPKIQIEEEVES